VHISHMHLNTVFVYCTVVLCWIKWIRVSLEAEDHLDQTENELN